MNAIKTLESRGYTVISSANMWRGKLDEDCPVVYEILNPDHSEVYGANGLSINDLNKWLILADLNKKPSEKALNEVVTTIEQKEVLASKELNYDNLYNEGAEGYNPYRSN